MASKLLHSAGHGVALRHAWFLVPLHLLLILFSPPAPPAVAAPPAIEWQSWSDAVLVEARQRGRMVYVNGFSKACPWCRKMEDGTFRDEGVRKLVSESFIPVRLNLRHPDEVPARFSTLIPPAHVVMAPDGEEVFSHRGYLSAEEISAVLRDVLAGRVPRRDRSLRDQAIAPFVSDLSVSAFHLQLRQARRGDQTAREGLDLTVKTVVNRADGEKHLENIPPYQEAIIAILVEASRAYERPRLLDLARRVAERSSESAEERGGSTVKARGAQTESSGLPLSRVAEMMEACARLYGATGDGLYLREAEKRRELLARDLVKARGSDAIRGRIAFVQGLLTLYSITADRKVLHQATTELRGVRSMTQRQAFERGEVIERSSLARTSYLAALYGGDHALRKDAERVIEEVAASTSAEPADARVVEAVVDVRSGPIHITVVGPKRDPEAQGLWREALGIADSYVRREWLDRAEGPLPNQDVTYPILSRPAAFVCALKRCSLPLFTPGELRGRLEEILPPL